MQQCIHDVKIIPKKKIHDDRGSVYHMLRNDDPEYDRFGEIYFSVVNPGIVKGWHIHKDMCLNYAVVHGMIHLALYDERENSPTKGYVQEIDIGENNYCLVCIPCGIWNAFKGTSDFPAIVANCTTMPYSDDDIVRIDTYKNNIPYKWK